VSLAAAVAFTLNRRVTVLVFAALTVIVGLLCLVRLPVELVPPGMTSAELTVWIPVDAANPAEVQETVVRPTEENLRTIPGIVRLASFAGPNNARIRVQFSKTVDLDLAAAEVRDRVERSRPSWPREVRRYNIFRFNADTDIPIMTFGLAFEKRSDDLSFLIDEKVVKPLEATPGVARVQVWGLLDDQIRIYVDREKALASGIDLYRLTQDLENANLDVSGGEIDDGGVKYSLRTEGRFRSLDDVREYPIRPGLKLGQIADVRPEQAVRDFVALSRNRFALWCIVQKESTANTVATCDGVRETLRTKIASDGALAAAGVKLMDESGMDAGRIIGDALAQLKDTAVSGAWLALIVLLWFLRRLRLTIVVTLAIPLSLLVTAVATAATGGSLNMLSLLGITIAIGMLVDNAIVVTECILQKRDLGLPPLAAARAGAAEVALAVALSTLTTVVAFLPIIFMSGDRDVTFFTSAIGLPLCYAVSASLVVALVFVPLGTVVFYPSRERRADPPWLAKLRTSPAFDRLAAAYARSLAATLRRPRLVALAVLAVAGIVTKAAWDALPKTDLTDDRGGSLSIDVDLEGNFTLTDAFETFTTLGRVVESKVEEYGIKDYWAFFRRTGGDIDIKLRTKNARRTAEIAELLKKDLPKLPGVRIQAGKKSDEPEKAKTTFRLTGPDVAKLEELARDAADLIQTVPGVAKAKSDLEPAAREIHIAPDREKLSRLGVIPEALWGTVQYGVRGFPLNDLVSGEREIPLIVQYEGGAEATLTELRETALFSRAGGRVPMSAVADLSVTRGFAEIRREGGKTGATITVDVNDSTKKDETRKTIKALLDRLPLPDGYAFEDKQGVEMAEGMKEMSVATALAAVFVFLLMGIMFESFVLPFAVLLSAPFSWAGAVWLLAAMSTPLDMIGSISLILLVGVVVNNGIVLIDCAHRLQLEGRSRTESLVEAGRLRLRPILMTALTTIVGLVPTGFAAETNSEISYKALALAVIGGMTVATFLQLYVVPVAYVLLDEARKVSGAALRAATAGFRTR
jgi:HAE1 family hydrophobic/amphiphilic exporter-1